MKFGFVTCVELGYSCMKAIYEIGGKLDIVITLKDELAEKKSGRVYLDQFCNKNNIQLFKCNHINDAEIINVIKENGIDWLFIIGWSQIANINLLNSPKLGVLGMHPSLLPVGRGRAAIPWAILKGLDKTGVSLFKLDEGVDTGDLLAQQEINLNTKITATELYAQVNDTHVNLMKHAYPLLCKNSLKLKSQDDSFATIWPGRKPEDGKINLSGSVFEAERLIRAVTHPYPGAFININDEKYIIWSARITSEKSNKFSLNFNDGILECLDFEKIS